jgi:hypothetical protein
MDADQIRKHYIAAWTRFNSNVSALYSFFEKLTEIADTFDKEKIKRMSIDLAPLFKPQKHTGRSIFTAPCFVPCRFDNMLYVLVLLTVKASTALRLSR